MELGIATFGEVTNPTGQRCTLLATSEAGSTQFTPGEGSCHDRRRVRTSRNRSIL